MLRGSRAAWLVVILAAPLLALAERGFERSSARLWSASGGARWIWAEPTGTLTDASFFVFRDFELSAFPGRARIHCQADESYFLYLNGQLLGAGRVRDNRGLDTYEVGYRLEPGVNRILVELRSSRGEGGLLLQLDIEGEDPQAIETDESWWVSRDYVPELLESGAELARTEAPAVSLSAPPVGRWGLPEVGQARSEFADVVALGAQLHAPRARSERTGDAWRGLAPPDVSSPPLGSTVTFDWGREVTGYANIVFGRKEGASALVFGGLEPPDPESDRPIAYLVNPAGRKSWSDTEPRTFRYLTVVATAEMVGARVLPLEPTYAASVLQGASKRPGVFGLGPLKLRAPLENEIRSELERLASIAEGEGV